MLNPNIGLVNGLLRQVGIQGPEWFSPGVGNTFLYYHEPLGCGRRNGVVSGGVAGVPTALYDAAKADGAQRLAPFLPRHAAHDLTSDLFQLFDGSHWFVSGVRKRFLCHRRRPANASLFYVLYLFRNGWEYFRMGYASALAWVLFLIIMAATLVSFKLSGRFVYYETSET